MQLFFYLFGPGINPLWRRGSGTTDPAQVYSIKVVNEWIVKFVCLTKLKVTVSMQIHTARSQMSIGTFFKISLVNLMQKNMLKPRKLEVRASSKSILGNVVRACNRKTRNKIYSINACLRNSLTPLEYAIYSECSFPWFDVVFLFKLNLAQYLILAHSAKISHALMQMD